MRRHRFYTADSLKLKKDFWLHDQAMLWQWNKVLRFKEGQEVILFDGSQTDRLYRIVTLKTNEAHLHMVTELARELPKRNIYLLWALLKRDNNEYILQKCTELGVSNFVPVITERTIKKEFNIDRAHKIVQEAAEQCGRSDIPHVREPLHLVKALEEYKEHLTFFVAHKGHNIMPQQKEGEKYGILIGPEGGWSEAELAIFARDNYPSLDLGDFTLRAETAAIVASAKLLQ
jgi:16S rRNA (uracil1498-N3)-methyltransferase